MVMLLGIQRPEVDETHEVKLQHVIDDFTSTHETFVKQIEVEKHCPKEGFGSLTRCAACLHGLCFSVTPLACCNRCCFDHLRVVVSTTRVLD